ncbi:polysaccharide deacetylase family protein [Alicyclobacillus fastidiosus]|uniref:Polysaccharide deacetylase family protein n=1 Tax=Alicyclobacillus fastidiosus TaxID=392011 RepID=A0ABY6Z9T0_9BACL|nr:polysaccharide deacetylase family protein [Alicyclobacillus fastidiosus]WAH39634.1 polysaccharide deacetylase family protein [Alicyclobacillus fastidiosus]GMA60841.1 polysaccharide deacetylase family sporulation protein PdaB [Alicyclobacillus fastidiosus]
MHRTLRALLAAAIVMATFFPTDDAAQKKDRFYFERLGYAHWQVPTHRKVVALTFDDGPDPTYTPQVLQLLAENHDQATFFLIGRKVSEHPDIVRQTEFLGNELGNHTFSHRHLAHMNTSELAGELDQTQNAILQATGQKCKYFRPPRGYYDEPSVLTAHDRGYPVIMWSWDEDSRDWQAPGVHNIVNNVLKHVHPGDIILMHDGTGNSKQTIAALRKILPDLHKRGYQSVTISDLLRSAERIEAESK